MNTKSDGFKVLLGVVAGMAAIILFGLVLSYAPQLATGPVPTPTPGGIAISRYRALSDVTLINQANRPMKLSDLRGKPTLIVFGYTFCPDVCPMSMADLRRVKRELGAAGDRVNFVFISVDPDRDTPAVIERYVTAFDPNFIGLTGDVPTLQKLIYEFDGLFEKQKPQGSNPNSYLVAHTSFTYLLDAEGRWRMKYSFGTPPEVIAEDVRGLLDV